MKVYLYLCFVTYLDLPGLGLNYGLIRKTCSSTWHTATLERCLLYKLFFHLYEVDKIHYLLILYHHSNKLVRQFLFGDMISYKYDNHLFLFKQELFSCRYCYQDFCSTYRSRRHQRTCPCLLGLSLFRTKNQAN